MGGTYDFYSIGDSAFLEQILNGVAMLSGNGDIKMLVMIGMVFGVLIIGFQAVENTSHIDWFKAIIGWVIYLIAFGSMATVAINDVYNGQIRLVANVPVGVAIVGSWTSAIGQEITQKFEQVFSLPSMTSEGFAGGVKTLLKAEGFDMAGDLINAGVPGANIPKTTYNYLRDCTLEGIDLGQKTMKEITEAEDSLAAIAWPMKVYGTRTFLPGDTLPGGSLRDCADAHVQLTKTLHSLNFENAVSNALIQKLHVAPATGVNGYNLLQNPLDALTGFGHDARTFMRNSFIKEALAQAKEGHAIKNSDIGSALILSQANNQLRLQQVAEGSLFMRIVHPLMTFMEGFVFAITPIVMLLIAMGSLGIRMAGKYIMLLLWVQLWMPVMAIINLYLNMTVSREMTSLQTLNHISPTSIAGQIQAHATMIDWLGTAGLLAAATPALSMMLIYGSAVAATALAGRLSSSDTVDENLGAPPVATNAGYLRMGETFNNDPTRGTQIGGATVNQRLLSEQSILSNAVSSSQQAAHTASVTATRIGSHSATGISGVSHSDSIATAVANRATSAHGAVTSDVHNRTQGIMENTAFLKDTKAKETFEAGVSSKIAKGESMKGAFAGQIKKQFGTTNSQAASTMMSNLDAHGTSEQYDASLNQDSSVQANKISQDSATTSTAKTDLQSYAKAKQDQSTNQKIHSNIASQQHSAGVQRSGYLSELPGFHNNVDAIMRVDTLAKSMGIMKGNLESRKHFFNHKLGDQESTKAEAMAMAETEAMYIKGTMKGASYNDYNAAEEAFGLANGDTKYKSLFSPDSLTPSSNAGIAKDVASTPNPTANTDREGLMTADQIENTNPILTAKQEELVATDFQTNKTQEEQGRGQRMRQQGIKQSDEWVKEHKVDRTNNLARKGARAIEESVQFASNVLEQSGIGIGSMRAVGSGYSEGSEAAKEKGEGLFGQVAAGMKRAIEKPDEVAHEDLEKMRTGLYEVARGRGVSKTQANAFADAAMRPVVSGLAVQSQQLHDDGHLGIDSAYGQRLVHDGNAVSGEIQNVFKDDHGSDSERAGNADGTVQTLIFEAANTGDLGKLDQIAKWDSFVGLDKEKYQVGEKPLPENMAYSSKPLPTEDKEASGIPIDLHWKQ